MPYVWNSSQPPFQDRSAYGPDRAYDSKGFAMPPDHPYWQMMQDGYRHAARMNPEKDAYWQTKLNENPLGLQNMHIK